MRAKVPATTTRRRQTTNHSSCARRVAGPPGRNDACETMVAVDLQNDLAYDCCSWGILSKKGVSDGWHKAVRPAASCYRHTGFPSRQLDSIGVRRCKSV